MYKQRFDYTSWIVLENVETYTETFLSAINEWQSDDKCNSKWGWMLYSVCLPAYTQASVPVGSKSL